MISIITPTYNRANYLEKNILSVKSQNYNNIEHIIVDGASSDNTIEILKKYENTYNMKWISEKDSGIPNAMNKGFKMAKGDIFCWLDSDDIYLDTTLKKIIDIFTKNSDIDVVFGDILISDQNDKIINYIKNTKFDINALIHLGMNLQPQATFWKQSTHNKLKGFNEKYISGADYDFFLRMALSGAKFYHIKDFLAVYRVHQGNNGMVDISNNEREEIIKNYKVNSYKKFLILAKSFLNYTIDGNFLYAFKRTLMYLKFIKRPI